jgi:hypothetical protein
MRLPQQPAIVTIGGRSQSAAILPQGFVHNRTSGHMPLNQIVRHLRKVVFSARI